MNNRKKILKKSSPAQFKNVEAFLVQARAENENLSKQLKVIVRHVEKHRDRLALDGIQETARQCAVQPSALVRFAKHFGFSGYTEMQALFRADAARQLAPNGDYQERIRALVDSGASTDSAAHIARVVVEGSIDSLQVLQRSLQTPEFDASFDKAVALMAEAPTLWLVASRRSFPVGAYLAYALQHTGKPVHWLHGLGHMQTDQLRALRPGDVMIAISFEPYARETLEVVSAGCDRGALLLAITDSRLSPLVQLSQVALLVQDSSTFGFRSLTSTLSMVQSLFLGLAYKLELAYEQGSSQR
jgi:DNA-binding MurR/RpiR family transcriptional regulator